MGHRFSKTAANNIAAATAKTTTTTATTQNSSEQQYQALTATNRISIPNGGSNHFVGPTINLKIQESPDQEQLQQLATCNTTTSGVLQQQQPQQYQSCSTSISSSLTSVNNLSCGGRQIIIKIQLAKMENGNETSTVQQQHQDTSLGSLTADCNLNSTELSTTTTTAAVGAQFLNLTLNSGNSMPNTAAATSSSLSRTAGSSLAKNNNYLNSNNGGAVSCSSTSSTLTTTSNNERLGRFNNTLQFNDEIVEQNIGEIVEYCEVLEEQNQPSSNSNNNNNNHMHISNNGEQDNETNVCCRRKSKSLAANGGSMSSSNNTGAKTKSRCRKCSCRDAFRRILDPSLSRSSNKANKQQQQKEQKRPKSQDRHSNNLLNNTRSIQRHTMHSTTMTNSPITSMIQPPRALAASSSAAAAAASAQQVSLWAPHATTANVSDVIIPLTTPQQFVVVQCAIVNPINAPQLSNALAATTTNTSSTSSLPNSIVSITNDMSSLSTTSSSNDIMVKVPSSSRTPGSNTITTMGPIVHSQVDFVHYLVPDLERITNSSFYWGKMDRYEAERLLDGKPEGTFLLRDSAQEEYLFSVTFRKYGRSLHARIEQSGHRFSFDCHDPCVFTASTVTGLLEHYKDPACVMFFEPMLTIPLHRKNCFSLQKLCRATIVSNTTYDGINELELPARLKSYMKEYHYKQKLRVKSNEPTYTTHCK